MTIQIMVSMAAHHLERHYGLHQDPNIAHLTSFRDLPLDHTVVLDHR